MVNNSNLVVDVIQDFFVSLWEKREKSGQVKRIKPYLYRAAQRRITAGASKERKLPSSMEIEKQIKEGTLSTDPEYDVTERESQLEEEQKALKRALERLSKEHQQLIYLKFTTGLSYDEIAEVMDMKVRNVYYHMSRALELLNRDLSHLIRCLILITKVYDLFGSRLILLPKQYSFVRFSIIRTK